MSVLQDILTFFLKRRIERIEHFKANPVDVQLATFKSLLAKGKDTEWGKKYAYRSITTYEDYRSQVPINNYEELYPYIERILKGERNILWPTPIEWFSKSSGTTNARSKFIPVSQESLEDCHYRGGKDLLTLYFQNRPDSTLFDGKGLSIGGALHTNEFNSKTKVGDISAVMMRNLPSWAEYLRTPPLPVALMDDWEQKMEKMIQICSKEDLTSILGVPTWTVVLLERIKAEMGVDSLLEIWPNFELFVHGAVSFEPYRELFKTSFFPSDQVQYMETYNASEGYFGIQDDLSKHGEMLLMLDYGIFYEFVPMEEVGKGFPQSVHIGEVELNKTYAIVISTNAGLWRYQIGDTIKFTSTYPHRIKITGRTKHFINAFGEELIIENAERAMAVACEATGTMLKDFTAAPVFMKDSEKGCHEWIIELKSLPADKEKFVHQLDATLRAENSDYDAKRNFDLALSLPRVHFVPSGTFYKWMDKRGKLGGQNKVPRLSNQRDFVEDLKDFCHL